MDHSQSGLIQKNSKLLIGIVASLVIIWGLVYFYNLYLYRQILTSSQTYKESILSPVFPQNPTSTFRVGENVDFEWDISSPVDRNAQKTFVLYGSDSSPSATLYESNPDKMPYPMRTTDYSLGDFKLPYRFTSTVKFVQKGVVFYRFYAKVDGRDLYTPEFSLKITD
jgi:hypothetical protein